MPKEANLKYAVIGAAGQLGRDLCPRLAGEVVALTRERADLTRPDSLRGVLAELKPDVVINCAAYNFVDRAESEPDAAFAVNAWGVRELARTCAERGIGLVQFSSDYVFGLDEARRTPYRAADAPGPVSVYGLSKLTGEYVARALCPRHWIVRTCGLYGIHGTGGKGGNFVETMLRLHAQGKPIRVVSDQMCTPSYTVDVAAALPALISSAPPGVYHLTNSGAASWYEFARAIFELSGVVAEVTPIRSQEFGAAARRPGYSVLAPGGTTSAEVPPLRPWREALAAYLEERKRQRREPS
jgi:dTDP-4-dehydrorhamnose reductase